MTDEPLIAEECRLLYLPRVYSHVDRIKGFEKGRDTSPPVVTFYYVHVPICLSRAFVLGLLEFVAYSLQLLSSLNHRVWLTENREL